MKNKDWGYHFLIIGTILFISAIGFILLTILVPILLSFSFLSPIIICIGLIFVAIGGLTKEKKNKEN